MKQMNKIGGKIDGGKFDGSVFFIATTYFQNKNAGRLKPSGTCLFLKNWVDSPGLLE